MSDVFCLDPSFSTTRRVTHTPLSLARASGADFTPVGTLPPHPDRRGEGGLRTRGLFKSSDTNAGPTEEERRIVATRRPVITIVTAVYNGARTIDETIASVLGQSYDNVEYIIVDGGSNDGTQDIVRRHEHAIDYWISERDGGIYDAWNKGVRLASGDWIAFLGADDTYLDGAIDMYASMISRFRDDEVPDYISSRVDLVRDDARLVRTIGGPWTWQAFRRYMNVAHAGSLHRRTLFERYGLYDTTYRICGDYELLLRPTSRLKTAFGDSVTVRMRIGGVSDKGHRALLEAEKAKVATGGRNALMGWIERNLAAVRWFIRARLWY